MRARVAIVGAGPAGAATAIHLGQLGVSDVVLVDRSDFPRDKTCGSGISPKGIQTLKALGLWEDVERHAYWIRGLRLVTPGDRELYLSGGAEAAAVICLRRILDQLLVDRARGLGVRFVPRFTAATLLHEGTRVVGFASRDGREVRADYTVVADGAHSVFRVDPEPGRRLQAIMGWWDHVPFRAGHVEMLFDRMVTPGYGWLFAESETRVNIGICYEDADGSQNGRRLFERFLAKHYATRLGGATPVGRIQGHPVAYAFDIGRLTGPGRLVVGEAGRLCQPATAEGIYQGMRSGMLAAAALRDILAGAVGEAPGLAAYEAACRRTFQRSFRGARLWRRAVSTPVLDWAVAVAQRPRVSRAIGRLMAAM
jgi:menaquinone-9 beta-reductase